MGGLVGRALATLATLGSAPWRRAPALLVRKPGVLATMAGATVVLSASAAAVPIFLSSAGTEAVAVQVDERCPAQAGVQVAYHPFPSPILRQGAIPDEDPLARLDDQLGRRISTLSLEIPVRLTRAGAGPGSRSLVVQLMARDQALDHTVAVGSSTSTTAAGHRDAWITDRAAEALGLARGDEVRLGAAFLGDGIGQPDVTPVDVTVAGIYRDLAGYDFDDYWCAMSPALQPNENGDPPPPLLLVDRSTLVEVAMGDPTNAVVTTWEAPLASRDVTVAEAQSLVDRLRCTDTLAVSPDLATTDGSCPQDAEGWLVGPVPDVIDTDLSFIVDRSESIRTAVGGGVIPVAAFAALAGVGLVGAAAALWFDRRRQEVTLLVVRGVGPVAIGVKAVLELLVAVLAGAPAGFGLAYLAVRWLGPSATVEPAAVAWGSAGALAALVVAPVAIVLVVAARVGSHQGRPRRLARPGVVPWELGLAVATVISYHRLGGWGAPVVTSRAEVTRVDLLGLMFPVLFLTATVAGVARLFTLMLRPLRAVSRRWPMPLYLAVRRVATARTATVGLVAASAIAAGVLGYAATLTRSLNATLDIKAQAFVGSDLAVRLFPRQEVPPSVRGRSTTVEVFNSARVVERFERVYLLAIDPETFARGAFWTSSFASSSLDELLARLSAPPSAGRIPALVVGEGVQEDATIRLGPVDDTSVQIRQVAAPVAFPGMETHRPTVVVSATALAGLDIAHATEAWVRGDPAETLAVFEAAEAGFRARRNFSDVADQVSFLTVSWTFGFLQSLGTVAGLMALGGLTVYLDARRRARILAYSFARRMGLTRAAHRRALMAELTATVVVGCWLGLTVSQVGAWLAHARLDPVPRLPPAPVLRIAVALVVALAVVAAVVAGVGAMLAQRRTDRDNPVEVLRA